MLLKFAFQPETQLPIARSHLTHEEQRHLASTEHQRTVLSFSGAFPPQPPMINPRSPSYEARTRETDLSKCSVLVSFVASNCISCVLVGTFTYLLYFTVSLCLLSAGGVGLRHCRRKHFWKPLDNKVAGYWNDVRLMENYWSFVGGYFSSSRGERYK